MQVEFSDWGRNVLESMSRLFERLCLFDSNKKSCNVLMLIFLPLGDGLEPPTYFIEKFLKD